MTRHTDALFCCNAIRRLAPLLALGAMLFGQGPLAAQTGTLKPLDPTRTVKVGTVGQASDAGLYVAIEKGYFKELGINVELVPFQNSAVMIAPLGSGQLDVGGGAVSAALWNAELRRIGIRAVADKGSTRQGWSYFGLVVKNDSPIKGCADMKGKRVANASASNGILHAIELWLATCGLTLKDIDFKIMGYGEVPAALINGAIDVGHLGEPQMSLNEQKGLLRILARQEHLRPSEQVALLYYSEKFRSDPEVAQRFMVAYVRGIHGYIEAYAKGKPPADWFIAVAGKYTKITDKAVYALVAPAGLDRWGQMDLGSMRSDFEWFRKQKLIVAGDVKFEDPLDTSFVDFAKTYLEKHGGK